MEHEKSDTNLLIILLINIYAKYFYPYHVQIYVIHLRMESLLFK